ncbi:MAG: hypothetical protein QNK23_16270 [Crocinitomicaceae bacterium]|nr:hypothetical protein [Crocinitomicaceae bacterium]
MAKKNEPKKGGSNKVEKGRQQGNFSEQSRKANEGAVRKGSAHKGTGRPPKKKD